MAPSTRIAAPATSTRRADISAISIGWTARPQRLATSTTGCSPSIPIGSTRDRCGAAPWPRKAQTERSLIYESHPVSSLRRLKMRRAAMKLYDLKSGTNTRRVRIFLAEKGVKLPTVEVDMLKGENKDPDYLSKNPMGTMPLLELDDGTQLAESVAICRYVEELHPDPPLFGATPTERALIEMWNRRMELELLRPITDNFLHSSAFYKERLTQVADIAHHGRMHAQARMRWLNGELAMRPCIAGDRYSIADITAQCALILGKNTGTPIPGRLTTS